MTKRRVQKKHFRIVRELLNAGKPIPSFYMDRIRQYYGNFIDRRYLNVFRPWWYDQFDNWSKLDLSAEHKKHFNETEKLFTELSGIDLDKLTAEYQQNKRPPRKRKPRKEKPPEPIRKLRKPELFTIQYYTNGKIGHKTVEGEKVFEVNGYGFFIYHDGAAWVVSDISTGAKIYRHYRYKLAVKMARERIKENLEQYLELVEKYKMEA